MRVELGASGGQRAIQALVSVLLVVAALYFGQAILMPLTMAVLLTFLLGPLVLMLERRRAPRVLAVILVMGAIAGIVGSATWVIASQFVEMAGELNTYKANLKEKLHSFSFKGGAIEEVQETIKEVSKAAEEGGSAAPESATAQPLRVVLDKEVPFERLTLFMSTVLTPLANLAVIVVLVLFMLLNREDLRNRIVRLAGTRLTLTTRTLDDIGTRISRYLLASAVINGSFGIVAAAGLWAIGVHYALMWGFLAGLLRFIPYVGPMLGASMPITMAFIQFPGQDWEHLAMTVALFVVLELITNNLVEPLIYGHSAGVSTVALLVSVAFWTWVWGPMGLVLAVPLTVVMAVLGEHVQALAPLGILLGDKPPLASSVTYYQRLLASDVDEAASILEDQQKSGGLTEVYDDVLMPALVLAEKDREQGDLSHESQAYIWQVTREFIEDLAPAPEQLAATNGEPGMRARVLGLPAHDEADVLALEMLRHIVPIKGGELKILSSTLLISEALAQLADDLPDAVCISSLGPIGQRQTRGLCKRLRLAYPQLRIIVGRWGFQGDREQMTPSLKRRGADHVVTTLAEARNLLMRQQPRDATPGSLPESRDWPAPEARGDKATIVASGQL